MTYTKTQLSAAERILKSAQKVQKGKPALHTTWEGREGQYLTDGFRAARIKEKMPLPVLWGVHVGKFTYPDLDAFIDPLTNSIAPMVHLPLPAKKDLRAFIKAERKRLFEMGERPIPRWEFGHGLPWVNAQYLLDMMDLLPGCTALYPEGRSDHEPIYFTAKNGDGILLPVMTNHKDKK